MAAQSQALAGKTSAEPQPGWTCFVFGYDTEHHDDAGNTSKSYNTVYLAQSPSGEECSVCWLGTEPTDWHGKCAVEQHKVELSFNCRGSGHRPKATLCNLVADGVYEGYDYKRRKVVLTFADKYRVRDDGKWEPVTVPALPDWDHVLQPQ